MGTEMCCLYCGEASRLLWAETAVWHCPACDLHFRYPQPEADNLVQYYKTGWQEPAAQIISGGTDAALADVYVRRLLGELGLPDFRHMHLLELGAGTGEMVTAVCNVGGQVTAVEPFGQHYLRQKGVDVYRTLDDLPSVQFDGIYTIQVLEHLPAPWETLKKLFTFLKPGGWLYVSTINAQSLNARFTRSQWREVQNPGHLFFFTPVSLARLLADAGYGRSQRAQSTIDYPAQSGVHKQLNRILQKGGFGGELCYFARRL